MKLYHSILFSFLFGPGLALASTLPHNLTTHETDALIFSGSGTWRDEIDSIEAILEQHQTTYQEVNSDELNQMTPDQIAKYGIIIWPGGYGGVQAGSLTSQTHSNVRIAVQEKGVSYIGFCAGAFVAVAPTPEPGKDVEYGLGIVDGPVLGYYYLEDQGVDAAMTLATFADGSSRDLVWYGGPVTPNTPGGVIAKYPNGDPMISQMKSQQGFVILSAVHPTAPQATRDAYGLNDSDGLDFELTYKLIEAGLKRQPLPTF